MRSHILLLTCLALASAQFHMGVGKRKPKAFGRSALLEAPAIVTIPPTTTTTTPEPTTTTVDNTIHLEIPSEIPIAEVAPAAPQEIAPKIAECPKTPDTLLFLKRCRFFSEIMGVQKKSSAQVYAPRSLIVAVTVFCKVPDAQKTFSECVDDTFASTTCPAAVKSQLHSISTDYWTRYCTNVDDNIQTLKYLFKNVPIHLVDEEWEVGANLLANSTEATNMCVSADDLQHLVINPCARWYNRVIGAGSRDRPLDVYLNVATSASDIGLQCVKRRLLRATSCQSDLIYLLLRALYVFQGLPGVSIPLVYLDPSFKRQNPTPSGQCPARSVVGMWSNQFVQSVNRGVRYCPLTNGATDLLTTDTVEIVGILNVDQGITSVDIRFFNPTEQHDPLVWYKASGGKLPTSFSSTVQQQSTVTIEAVTGGMIPSDTQVVKISDAGVGQMSIYVTLRNMQYYDIVVSATQFDLGYATGLFVHSCARSEDIDYKTEVVNLQAAPVTGQFGEECEDACRSITTVGFHESCLIACMRRGGDSRIVNSINMLLGYNRQLARVCNITQYAPPVVISSANVPVVSPLVVALAAAVFYHL